MNPRTKHNGGATATAKPKQAWVPREQHAEIVALSRLSGRKVQEITRRVIAAGLPIVREAEERASAASQPEARA